MYETKSVFSLMTEEHPLLMAWQSHLFLRTVFSYIPLFLFLWLETSLGEHSFRALVPLSLALLNVKLLMILFPPKRSWWNTLSLAINTTLSYSTVNAVWLKVVPTFPLTHFLCLRFYTFVVKILSQMKHEKQDIGMMASSHLVSPFHSSDFQNIWDSF